LLSYPNLESSAPIAIPRDAILRKAIHALALGVILNSTLLRAELDRATRVVYTTHHKRTPERIELVLDRTKTGVI
jgi:hypothetical protein